MIALYNGLVQKRNRVDNAWAQIEVQLKRRHDLIPNLIETVKGYAAHERGSSRRSRRRAPRRSERRAPAQTAAAEGMLTQALGRLFAVAEAYPDLKANHELPRPPGAAPRHRGQDRGLAPGLQRHGADVQQRDPGVPGRLIAGMFGFTAREFFEVEDPGRPRGAGGQLRPRSRSTCTCGATTRGCDRERGAGRSRGAFRDVPIMQIIANQPPAADRSAETVAESAALGTEQLDESCDSSGSDHVPDRGRRACSRAAPPSCVRRSSARSPRRRRWVASSGWSRERLLLAARRRARTALPDRRVDARARGVSQPRDPLRARESLARA